MLSKFCFFLWCVGCWMLFLSALELQIPKLQPLESGVGGILQRNHIDGTHHPPPSWHLPPPSLPLQSLSHSTLQGMEANGWHIQTYVTCHNDGCTKLFMGIVDHLELWVLLTAIDPELAYTGGLDICAAGTSCSSFYNLDILPLASTQDNIG